MGKSYSVTSLSIAKEDCPSTIWDCSLVSRLPGVKTGSNPVSQFNLDTRKGWAMMSVLRDRCFLEARHVCFDKSTLSNSFRRDCAK